MKPIFYWCLVGNGWVAGGCWDDQITNVMTGIIPGIIPCVKRTTKKIRPFFIPGGNLQGGAPQVISWFIIPH